jgi:putative Holliday junction resolvase
LHEGIEIAEVRLQRWLSATQGETLASAVWRHGFCNGVTPSTIECMTAREESLPSRVLALDVGSKRIGVAVSDPLGITAQGLETIQRENKRRDFEVLERLLAKYEVREVVIGLPLRLSGAEGTQSEKMRHFADELRNRLGVVVHLWDERWTSTEANRLLRETDLSIEKRGKAVDRMAAVLILQSWLEARGSQK